VEFSTGRFAPAEDAFKTALTLEPRLRWARIGLANVYIRQKRWKDAVAQFDAYLKEFPGMSNRNEVEAARNKVALKLEPAPN
jgi:predicted Zn-dependent protease